MENTQIRESVDTAVNQWLNIQRRRGIEVTITPRAVDFIAELITNIRLDPSDHWRTKDNYNYEFSQEFAISLIPNALNDLTQFRDFRYSVHRNNPKAIKISSWELWGALSNILLTFCFIPIEENEHK